MNNIWIDEVGKIDEKTFNDSTHSSHSYWPHGLKREEITWPEYKFKPLSLGGEKEEREVQEEDCPFCGRTPCTEECIEASFPTKP